MLYNTSLFKNKILVTYTIFYYFFKFTLYYNDKPITIDSPLFLFQLIIFQINIFINYLIIQNLFGSYFILDSECLILLI